MKKIFCVLLALLLSVSLFAQIDERYRPKFFGTFKADADYLLDQSELRFVIKNARAGVFGKINDYIGYRFQAELNSHGKFVVLDTYGEFYLSKNFNMQFGQMQVPFAEAYVITPGQMMFSSLALVYPYTCAQGRDIGLKGNYTFTLGKLPLELQAGVFNGSGFNNPTWHGSPAVSARLIAGSMQNGWRGSVKYYGDYKDNREVNIYGADLRYAGKNWKIEAEWNTRDSTQVEDWHISSYFVQGLYSFTIKKGEGMLKYIAPAGRIESIGKQVMDNGFALTRLTLGLNFGFDVKPLKAEIRLNYENYLSKQKKDWSAYAQDLANYLGDNRLIMELLINF